MTGLSALLLAAAVLVAPGAVSRSRLVRHLSARSSAVGAAEGRPEGPPDGTGSHPVRLAGARRDTGSRREVADGSLALAAAWELLAACLRAGMPIPVAVRAVADGIEGGAGMALRQTADLLALGADSEHAWQPALDCAATARLARFARRSGRSGTALADSLIRLVATERATARERSEAAAQRAGVLIAGPLGLCFLPAFIAVGVLPVVIGLATGLMQQW